MQSTNRTGINGPSLAIGDVVEAQPCTYHQQLRIIGNRYQVGRITHHASGICYWGHPLASQPSTFIERSLCPLGDGSDFELIASGRA